MKLLYEPEANSGAYRGDIRQRLRLDGATDLHKPHSTLQSQQVLY